MAAYVYLVTLRYPAGGPAPSRWREYGSSGLTRAVESVDWDIRRGDATSGTVHRLNRSGGEEAEVYSRSAIQ